MNLFMLTSLFSLLLGMTAINGQPYTSEAARTSSYGTYNDPYRTSQHYYYWDRNVPTSSYTWGDYWKGGRHWGDHHRHHGHHGGHHGGGHHGGGHHGGGHHGGGHHGGHHGGGHHGGGHHR